MRASNIAVGIVFLLSGLVYAQGACDLDTIDTYVQSQTNQLYERLSAPNAKITTPNFYDDKYYIVFEDLALKNDGYRDVLYLQGVYCETSSKREVLPFEMHPGSSLNPGNGKQGIVYYGPVPNTLCQARDQAFSKTNTLFFSSLSLSGKSFEGLLFKKVTARTYRNIQKQAVVTRNKPSVVTRLPNFVNPLDDPGGVDEFAKSACKVAIQVYAQ